MSKSKIEINAESIGLIGTILRSEEKCAKLIQALSKYARTLGIGQKTEVTKATALSNLAEEVADVELCIKYLKHIIEFDSTGFPKGFFSDLVESYKNAKIEKVYNRYHKKEGDNNGSNE